MQESVLSSSLFKSNSSSLDCSTDAQSNAASDEDEGAMISIADFDIKRVVGDGGYSKVYLGTHYLR
jgi:hypothetical protein